MTSANLRDASVRYALVAALKSEQSPAAKAAIFGALQPTPLATEDLAPLLEELRVIYDTGQPELRAAALVHWAQWDRGDGIAPLLRDGLYDDSPQVVLGAVTAVALSNVRTQEMKEALLLLANDAAPDSEARVAALDALRDFSLSRTEDAIFRESEAALADGIDDSSGFT
ncbi:MULTISPECIES: hypothetical protein [Luteimonas]|uniref:hypothetical protein n=1 Tax=Luteimonas TaxID=83614 RepID=UPI000C7D5B11|nr:MULTISPECIES: hypothetical protein [Luteimonas]